MSDPCEIVESLITAESFCPATDVVMVNVSSGSALSNIIFFLSPEGISIGEVEVTDEIFVNTYAILNNAVNVNSILLSTTILEGTFLDKAEANSSVIQALYNFVQNTANVTDEIALLDIPQLLKSIANITSSVVVNKDGNMVLSAKGNAVSNVWIGLLESIQNTVNVNSIVYPLNTANLLLDNIVQTLDEAYPTNNIIFDLQSKANAVSQVENQLIANMLLQNEVEVIAYLWYADDELKAWVMNTETTAVSWYDNYGFESIAQVDGRVFGVGEDGVYELTGDDDNNIPIKTLVRTGFLDFDLAEVKRLDNLYFGYTSPGQISVKTEVLDSGNSPATFLLEPRIANAPRNSRITPGKGLWGRYWRLTLENVDGADFEVHDASVDLAVSPRRI